MNRSFSALGTTALVATFLGGCFPAGATGGSDGGSSGGGGFTGPTLELTVSGVHFGPLAPDPGAFVDLTTTRDASGNATASSFRLSATIGSAGCALAFDRFGNGANLGVGQYLVQSMQGSSTLDGTVYPTTAERIATPQGGAGCTGSTCDGAAFVLSALDAQHISGYFMGTVNADSGAGAAAVVCSFWLKPRTYAP